jgi:hypothetical protein
MTDQHPMTPPTELLTRWENDWFNEREHADVLLVNAYAAGAQAGADQELEACCEWLHWQNLATHSELIPSLRARRRPKPPSLKEQALQALSEAIKMADDTPPEGICSDQANIIRRALEQLDD